MSRPDIACICKGAVYAQNDTFNVQAITACIFVIFRCSSDAKQCKDDVASMSDQCSSDVWERFGLVVRSRRLLIPNGFGEFVTRRRKLDLFSYLSRSAYKDVIRCRRVLGVHYVDIHRYRRGESVSLSGQLAQEVDQIVDSADRIRTMAKWSSTPIISDLAPLCSGGDPCCHVVGRHVLRPRPRPVWGSLGRHVAHKGPLESPYGHDGVSQPFTRGTLERFGGYPVRTSLSETISSSQYYAYVCARRCHRLDAIRGLYRPTKQQRDTYVPLGVSYRHTAMTWR